MPSPSLPRLDLHDGLAVWLKTNDATVRAHRRARLVALQRVLAAGTRRGDLVRQAVAPAAPGPVTP